MRAHIILAALAIAAASSAAVAQDDARLLRFPATNGSEIAFTYAGDLWTVPAEGGEARRLTSPFVDSSDRSGWGRTGSMKIIFQYGAG